jgi:repressor LexA
MMTDLSLRQKKILEFIRHYLSDKAYPPTIRDIVAGCGISSTSVADYNLEILEKQGYIKRHREVSRGIELLDGPSMRERLQVPLIGQIAAGQPIPVPGSESWNSAGGAETLEVTSDLTRGKGDVYALRVKGLSMVDALINDGDIILMQAASSVENGEMAAVWLKDEKTATLKKVYAGADRVRLQPANSQMQPIYAKPEDVQIQGKVIAVIRQLT